MRLHVISHAPASLTLFKTPILRSQGGKETPQVVLACQTALFYIVSCVILDVLSHCLKFRNPRQRVGI